MFEQHYKNQFFGLLFTSYPDSRIGFCPHKSLIIGVCKSTSTSVFAFAILRDI